MPKQVFEKFLGARTIVNPRLINKKYASATRDIRVDNGDLALRSGWRNLYNTAIGNWAACYGFYFLRGISSTGTVTDEYIAFQRNTVTGTFAYRINVVDGTTTVITAPGPTSLPLNASEWGVFVWRDTAYIFNPNDSATPIASYLIGDTDSLTAITRPVAPDSGDDLTYTISYPNAALDVTSAVAGDITGTGTFSSASNPVGSQYNIAHNGTTGATSFTFNMKTNLGNQNYEYADIFTYAAQYFTAVSTHDFRINWDSFRFYLINDDGSPVTVELEILAHQSTIDATTSLESARKWVLRYPPSASRLLRDNIAKLKVEYTVTATDAVPATNDGLTFLFWTKGGIDINSAIGAVDYLDIQYAYRNSSSGTISLLSDALRISFPSLKGWQTPITGYFYGYNLSLTAQASAESGVDQWALYASYILTGETTGSVRGYFKTFSDTTELTSTWGVGYEEYLLGTLYELGITVNIDLTGILCAAVYKNWVILGFRGGVNNIRHSWQNRPLFYAFPGQSTVNPDLTRGVDFTMGAYGSDDPIQIIPSGDHVYITGSRAIYAQVGADSPAEMKPPIPIPNSQGAAGRYACCAWKKDNGQAGVVYLGKDFDSIWFATVGFAFQTRGEHLLEEYSANVRGSIKDFLFDGATPADPNFVQMYVDERADALILGYQDKKMVLRRPNDIEGEREWEYYHYEDLGAWYRSVADMNYGIRHIRQGGKVDESEYYVADDFSLIEGLLRDGGSAIPSTGRYWQSADVSGEIRRADTVYVEKQEKRDEVYVTMIDSDGTEIETVKIGRDQDYGRFSPDAQSRSRKYKFQLQDGAGKVYRVEIEEGFAPQRR